MSSTTMPERHEHQVHPAFARYAELGSAGTQITLAVLSVLVGFVLPLVMLVTVAGR